MHVPIAGGTMALYCAGIPLLLLFALIIIINLIQNNKPHWLPSGLRNWHFLPLPLRSLAPYDRVITRLPCCATCRNDR